MFRPSRRAVVFAASFALAFASVAPSAHAERGNHDDDTDEQSGGLLDLIDITDLLGGLPLLGETGLGGLGLPALDGLPTVEGIGLPTLEGLGLPLEGLGLPALEGLGLPGLEGLGVPLPIGDPLSLLNTATGPGLDLNVLIRVGLSGDINLL